jgi:metal-dependent amidase/aminoacylase/carboxypeptidase family protein
METQGFVVERHYLLDTAWVATYTHNPLGIEGKGHAAVLGVNSEMDALPGIGHACGHNLIGVAGVAVACAVKAALETLGIGGKVVLLGTPGEPFPCRKRRGRCGRALGMELILCFLFR